MKRLVSIVICLVVILSISVAAFACSICKSDSVALNPQKSISITGDGVHIRPHHRASDNEEDKPGGSAYWGDVGIATHKYPNLNSYTWVRAEMDSGINGWIYRYYVQFS